jgi:hypothetical protein
MGLNSKWDSIKLLLKAIPRNDSPVRRAVHSGLSQIVGHFKRMILQSLLRPMWKILRKHFYSPLHFIKNEDNILFEIVLHPGDIAICIADHSVTASESEILIAELTGFKMDQIESIDLEITESDDLNYVRIPVVKMCYFLSWSDFDIDECSPRVLVEDDAM